MAKALGIAAILVRLGLGGLFIWAGVLKIWNFRTGASATPEFFEDIMNYHLTSWDVSMVIAVYLPWLEVAAGVALVIRRLALGASIIIGGSMLVFIAALASAWARGIDISCGCFGHEEATANFPLLLARDLGLLAAAIFAAWFEVASRRRGMPIAAPAAVPNAASNIEVKPE